MTRPAGRTDEAPPSPEAATGRHRPARRWWALSLLLLAATVGLGASRARYGGSLKVTLAGRMTQTDPLLADTPAEAALLALVTRSVCLPPAELSRASPLSVKVASPDPGAVAAAWRRLAAEPTPYRALLAPLKDEGRALAAGSGAVELALQYPWPDLERSLCHPALSVPGSGPFQTSAAAGTFAAQEQFAAGRAFVDSLTVTASDARGAERLFAQRKAQLALGLPPVPGADTPPLLFATYLGFSRAKVGEGFRQAFESSVDRADLTRFFVRAPAAPLPGLLPGVLGKPPGPRPAALSPAREVSLLYDVSLEDQRAVAERLQVRLHPLGYKVALKGLPRRELRQRWQSGDFELMLSAVLLPPRPAPAVAVVLELARQHEVLSQKLPALGAIAVDAARDGAARELASSLAATVDLLPLYAQGLAVQAAPGVQALHLDEYGLPRFDELFLGNEP